MVGGNVLIVYEGDEAALDKAFEAVGDDKNEPTNAYVVKLVDYAHKKLETGIGPDEGVVKGLDTMVRLLEGRIAENIQITIKIIHQIDDRLTELYTMSIL
jgi:1D-myo-inositol-tetrakisphosphate 5-kinase/inositol-polyphosphate multikinase